MGFLNRLFGRGTAPAVRLDTEGPYGGKFSLQNVLAGMDNVKFSSQRCGMTGCSQTFLDSNIRPKVMTLYKDAWIIDIGGYCPSCKVQRCHKHVRLDGTGERCDDGTTLYTLTLHCTSCGTETR